MPIQKKHQKALLTLHDITRARSKHGPGEPSPQGFRRLGLRVPQVRAMVGAGYTFHEGVSRSEILNTWHHVFNNTDKLGPLSLVVAKFVPGLQTLAPPMAGLTGMSVTRFLILDTVGTLVWSGSFVGLGILFSNQLEAVATKMAEIGFLAGASLVAIVLIYFAYKFLQRVRFLKTLEMRRVEPKDVFEMMQSNKELHVIDLRHRHNVNELPEKIPSAVSVPMEAMERQAHRIPKDSDIILYCS